MPHRAPRILTLLLATAGACLAASSVQAQSQSQSAPAAGRYLTWANRPVGTTPADVAAVQARARTAMIPRRVAPSQASYRPMMQPTSTPVPASRGLTPASAWLGPRVVPAYAPGSPDPLAYATTEMAAPAPTYSPPPAPVERAAVDPMAPRRDAPVFNMQRQTAASTAQAPVPQQAPQQAPQPGPADPNDPMAPRRDARIFQMQQGPTQGQEQAVLPAPAQQAPSSEASVQAGQSGARYYSVHRDAGHRPDPTALPEPVYFDSVTMDLAEPPENEPQTRDAQGRRRVVPNADPSLP